MTGAPPARRKSVNELAAAASEGKRLPTTREILRGCCLYREDLRTDAARFADGAMALTDAEDDVLRRLLAALSELTLMPNAADYVAAAEAFEAVQAKPEGEVFARIRGAARCWLYAALAGERQAAHKVASQVVDLVYAPHIDEDEASDLACAAVAWLMAANGQVETPGQWTRAAAPRFVAGAGCAPGAFHMMVSKILTSRRATLAGTNAPETAPVRTEASDRRTRPCATDGHRAAARPDGGAADDLKEPLACAAPSAVVFRSIGAPETPGGQRILQEFADLLGRPLRLKRVPDLRLVLRTLQKEFPHAAAVADEILFGLVGCQHVVFRPTLLLGGPGCGKTTFAARLAALLGLPCEILNCGGLPDASPAGTPRRWSTGGPSLPVALMRAHLHASPVIVLDEIEKAGTGQANGRLWDGLLAMLEPSTAHRWRDVFLEAPVDISHAIWLATANSVANVPGPLLDRFRILAFPDPRREHLAILAHRLLIAEARRRGLDPRWAPPLDGVELATLARFWPGGSLRRLDRLVSVVAASREHLHAQH